METFLVGLLAVLRFRTMHGNEYVNPGIVLGALVANKLDAGVAAISYAAICVISRRVFPWRTTLVAPCIATPILVVRLVTFASIVPNSMLIKLTWHTRMLWQIFGW